MSSKYEGRGEARVEVTPEFYLGPSLRLRQLSSTKAETLTNHPENIIVKNHALELKARHKTRQWFARTRDK